MAYTCTKKQSIETSLSQISWEKTLKLATTDMFKEHHLNNSKYENNIPANKDYQ